jgi:hypothetical protein
MDESVDVNVLGVGDRVMDSGNTIELVNNLVVYHQLKSSP